MDIPNVHPPAIPPGGTIAVVAPAGPVDTRESLERSVATLERLGFRARFESRIFESTRYLAGDDAARVEELIRAFEDPAIDGIIALRGGYGCARLIRWLDERRLRPNCKLFMGFSDLTTLHLYFRRRFGWVTLHGPMMTSAVLASPPADLERHLVSLWSDPGYKPSLTFPQLETWKEGEAEGHLVGGCLSLIVASLGTAYEIRTEGRILLLEEFGEEPYRIDRMLTQLRLAGKLDVVGGIIVGGFEGCEPEMGGYGYAEVLRDLLSEIDAPIVAGFPAGHGAENWPLPMGTRVHLNAGARTIEFLDSLVRPA